MTKMLTTGAKNTQILTSLRSVFGAATTEKSA